MATRYASSKPSENAVLSCHMNTRPSDVCGMFLYSAVLPETPLTSAIPSSFAAKLRKARRLARSGKINPRWKHPFYWAPYIMIGP